MFILKGYSKTSIQHLEPCGPYYFLLLSAIMEALNLQDKIRAMAADSLAAKAQFFERSGSDVARAAQLIIDAIRAGGKLLIFGNGGSAADAQHIASELAFKMGRQRAALPALALTTDTSLLTAISNDSNFDYVFARQIQALGRRGDIALAISTSGNSPNVIEAIKEAHAKEIRTIGLLGAGGGKAAGLVDIALIVPHDETPRIQEVHIAAGHIICRLIEDELCPN
jgi:D-sedoheptulose 7-phosphate isomerase